MGWECAWTPLVRWTCTFVGMGWVGVVVVVGALVGELWILPVMSEPPSQLHDPRRSQISSSFTVNAQCTSK